MFYNCYNLSDLNLSSFYTPKVEYMNDMFYSCKNLTSLDIKSFSFKSVKNLKNIFYNCENLKTLQIYNSTNQITNSVNISIIHINNENFYFKKNKIC